MALKRPVPVKRFRAHGFLVGEDVDITGGDDGGGAGASASAGVFAFAAFSRTLG
jgi:hypothetical protein